MPETEPKYSREKMNEAKAKVLKEAIEKKFGGPGRPSSQEKGLRDILEKVEKKLKNPPPDTENTPEK